MATLVRHLLSCKGVTMQQHTVEYSPYCPILSLAHATTLWSLHSGSCLRLIDCHHSCLAIISHCIPLFVVLVQRNPHGESVEIPTAVHCNRISCKRFSNRKLSICIKLISQRKKLANTDCEIQPMSSCSTLPSWDSSLSLFRMKTKLLLVLSHVKGCDSAETSCKSGFELNRTAQTKCLWIPPNCLTFLDSHFQASKWHTETIGIFLMDRTIEPSWSQANGNLPTLPLPWLRKDEGGN